MNSTLLPVATATTLLLLASGAVAQAVTVEAPRQSSMVAFGPRVEPGGSVYLHYGPATWRAAFEKEVEAKSAERFRLGTGYWATLNNSVPISLAGKKLPVNTWFLGLERSAEAAWALTLVDSSKVMRAGQIAGATRDVKPDIRVPLTFRKGTKLQPDLRVRFILAEGGPVGRGRLELRWHEFTATAKFEAAVQEVAPKNEPKFVAMRPNRTETTKSGLQWEELRPGVGASPKITDQVRVRYVMWLADGKFVDSSFTRKQVAKLPLQGVIRGWSEGLRMMKAGGVYRLRIPAKLGYGAAGARQAVPPNSVLESWIELVEVVRKK